MGGSRDLGLVVGADVLAKKFAAALRSGAFASLVTTWPIKLGGGDPPTGAPLPSKWRLRDLCQCGPAVSKVEISGRGRRPRHIYSCQAT